MPHATRELPAMRLMIDALLRKGHAYEITGGVYFDTSRARHYGELSRFSKARMRRILAAQDDAALDDPERRHPIDFALWRRVPSGPTWPSRYGRGRPGWHIECSAMSLRHLGAQIDIHGGGSDLIYPHHENEIAQSEGATGKRPFVGWWMHTGAVRLQAEKMSKSLGNMIFVRTALETTTREALRLYLLDSHYRRPFDHDEAELVRARERTAALAEASGPRSRSARSAATARRARCSRRSTTIWTRARRSACSSVAREGRSRAASHRCGMLRARSGHLLIRNDTDPPFSDDSLE